MLGYQRRTVERLLSVTDTSHREFVIAHVDGAMRALPEFLRAGAAGLTLLLSSWSAVRRYLKGRTEADDIEWLENHPLGFARQWLRGLRTLVLFAEQETMDDPRFVAGADDPSAVEGAAP